MPSSSNPDLHLRHLPLHLFASICTYVSWRDSYRPWKPVVFFLLLFVGGHAKGMPAVIVPLGVVVTHTLLPLIESLIRLRSGSSLRNELEGILKDSNGGHPKTVRVDSRGIGTGARCLPSPFLSLISSAGGLETTGAHVQGELCPGLPGL